MGILGIIPSYEWLITLLILAGIGICFFHPASFAAVGRTDAGRRSIVISYLMLASSLGFVVGPTLISLFTARCGMEKLYLIVIPGAIVTAALLKFFSRETGEGPRQNAKRRMNPFRAVLSPIFPFSFRHSPSASRP